MNATQISAEPLPFWKAENKQDDTYASLQEYNQHLIKNRILITNQQYFREVSSMFGRGIEYEFMEYFRQLVDRTDFCMNANELFLRYNIVSKSRSIKKCILEKNKLLEDIDYTLQRMVKRVKGNNGALVPVTEHIYMLTPKAFKLCLIRSGKPENIKYARYYIDLEEWMVYSEKYQIGLLQDNEIILKQRTEELDKRLTELEQERTESDQRHSMLMKQIGNIEQTLSRMEHDNRITTTCKNVMEAKLESVLPDVAHQPSDTSARNYFLVMKLNDTEEKEDQPTFQVATGMKKGLENKKRDIKKKYPNAKTFFTLYDHPNGRNLYKCLKENSSGFSYKYSKITLREMTVDEFRNRIKIIEKERTDV